jgi:hypothetical protein
MNDGEFTPLPYVQISTDGLGDRIHIHHTRQEVESTLAKRVRSDDHKDAPPLKERMTVDPVAWKVLPETRVYHGDRAATVRKGRRPFAGILHSRIEETLDQF